MDLDRQIYPGGFFALMRRLKRRETPFDAPLAVLPPPDVALEPLFERLLDDPPARLDPQDPQIAGPVASDAAPSETSPLLLRRQAARKQAQFLHEFAGQPEILLHHAMCIAILRRRDPPPEARALFLRLWGEQGSRLVDCLPLRWQISAATTFGDHGATMAQRLGGQGLALMIDMIKLHDSERRVSGRACDAAFPRIKGRKRDHPLALDMEGYSLRDGDLDQNWLARLWRYGEEDATLRPLAMALLNALISDPRSVFARTRRYRPDPSDDPDPSAVRDHHSLPTKDQTP